MNFTSVLDAIVAHAVTAAAGISSSFKDVAAGLATPRGRCVRIYYGGEAATEHFGTGTTLSSRMIGERFLVRGFWPVSEYGPKRGRAMMIEMHAFVAAFRTAILGDSQLNDLAADLNMHFAQTDDVLIGGINNPGGVHYAIVDIEIVVDYDEYAIAK